jgi:hypothetical protein
VFSYGNTVHGNDYTKLSDVSDEIQSNSRNICFHSFLQLLSSYLISKSVQIITHGSIILCVMNGNETEVKQLS